MALPNMDKDKLQGLFFTPPCCFPPTLTRQQLLFDLTETFQVIGSHSLTASVPSPLCCAPRPSIAGFTAGPTSVTLLGSSTIA